VEQLTFRGKDTLQISSHDIIQQRQIRFFRLTMRALVVRSRNRQWQKRTEMQIQGPNQLINHIKQVLLLKKTTYQYLSPYQQKNNQQNTTHVQSENQ